MSRKDPLGRYDDPLEARIASALDKAGISYVRDGHPAAVRLDFFLPEHRVHIEVKAFHSARISSQMERVPFCIAVQGKYAVEWLAQLIEGSASPSASAAREDAGER